MSARFNIFFISNLGLVSSKIIFFSRTVLTCFHLIAFIKWRLSCEWSSRSKWTSILYIFFDRKWNCAFSDMKSIENANSITDAIIIIIIKCDYSSMKKEQNWIRLILGKHIVFTWGVDHVHKWEVSTMTLLVCILKKRTKTIVWHRTVIF